MSSTSEINKTSRTNPLSHQSQTCHCPSPRPSRPFCMSRQNELIVYVTFAYVTDLIVFPLQASNENQRTAHDLRRLTWALQHSLRQPASSEYLEEFVRLVAIV